MTLPADALHACYATHTIYLKSPAIGRLPAWPSRQNYPVGYPRPVQHPQILKRAPRPVRGPSPWERRTSHAAGEEARLEPYPVP